MKQIKIHPRDNVAVALERIEGIETIPPGHKLALTDIAAGEKVIKYGMPIGVAIKPIKKGRWVHTHNVRTLLDETSDYVYSPEADQGERHVKSDAERSFFRGYVRENGQCAVRNEIWIIAATGCVNGVVQNIASELKEYARGRVDDVVAITHPYGCSQMGEDQENTLKALAAFASHPNAGGVLMVNLGCENCGADLIKRSLPAETMADTKRLRWLRCQDADDEIAAGVRQGKELIDHAANARREPVSADRLVVGLKCGGSDGMSGLTANPLVGSFTDRLCAAGGSAILTEVPEMFGAETLLMNRCCDRSVFEKTVKLINDYKAYFQRHGQVVYENPSPGNKAGGITTLEDKSLGCVQKGGSTSVNDVLAYGERITVPGLNLLEGPGNDIVATTALALSGAHIVLFTTGLGTPFGGLVPTVKIASNRQVYRQKNHWIDYDASDWLDEERRERTADDFYQYVLRVASGEKTKSEERAYREVAIFKGGVTL